MRRPTNLLLASSLVIAVAALAGCGKKDATGDTNVIEMNASDGSMNDMTVVESATLDQAGGATETNAADAGNASNAM